MDRGKVSRRKFLQLGAMAGGAMALAACPAAPAEAPMAAPEESSDDEMPMAEMLDLTLLSLKGTGWPKFNNFIVENFMEQTGHGATLQEAQWPIRDTVIPAIAAGTPPDVVHDMGKMSGALYIEGAYLTLNDLVDAAPFSPDDFIAADIDSLTFFGDIKKIPFWHNTVPIAVLAYRKDFVDEAGLSQPATEDAWDTYDDLWDWAGKLQVQDASGNITRFGWDHIGLTWAGFSVLGGVLDQGGHWWDEGAQEFTLDTDEVVNALQTIYFDPVYTYGVSYNNANAPDVGFTEKLFEGVVAVSQMNWPILIALDNDMMDMVEILGYSEIPGLAPGQHNYCYEGTWGAGIVASAPAEHHEAAFQLATMQLQPEVARVIMEIAGPASALKSFGDDPFLEELAAKHNAGSLAVFIYQRDVKYEPTFAGWEWMDGEYFTWPHYRCNPTTGGEERCGESGLGHIYDGRITAQQVAEEWQEAATNRRAELRKAAGLE